MSPRTFTLLAGAAATVLALVLMALPVHYAGGSCGSVMSPNSVPLLALPGCQSEINSRETLTLILLVVGVLVLIAGIWVIKPKPGEKKPVAGWVQRLATPVGDLKQRPQQPGSAASDATPDART